MKILLLVHLVLVGGINGLPKSSDEFLASYTCNNNDVQKLLKQQVEEGGFFKFVVAARHTTHLSGWEVNTKANDDNSSNKYYARVFDLLNYSRIHNLLSESISVDEVCHKGMETHYQHDDKINNWSDDKDIESRKPNTYIPSESWANLWDICHKQLSSSERLSSTCIDIPGVVVTSPSDKAYNPCNRKYRMVDGAHRLCLRKYLLLLLHGELSEIDYKVNESINIHKLIQHKKQLIEIYNQSMFIVINQTVFESMLMNDDPHTTWARDKQFLMKDITNNLQLDWKEWMGRVMNRVDEKKSNITLSTSNQDVSRDEL